MQSRIGSRTRATSPVRKRWLIVAAVILAAGPLRASEKSDVMATVHQFVDGFNKGDTKSALAVCSDDMAIIDEFPPYEWHGKSASLKWVRDFDADAKRNGITAGLLKLGQPRHVDISGDRAYVVVPTDYSFKQNGKPKKETASTWTLTLRKGKAGWLLTGWAWAKR